MAGHDIETPKAVTAFDTAYPLELESYAGLEAQIAALSDDVAYNSHDIDDGLRAGLFDLGDLRELPLLSTLLEEVDRKWPGLERQRKIYELVRQLIGALVMDLTEETKQRLVEAAPGSAADVRGAGKPMAAFSESMESTVNALRHFLKTHMYRHYRVNRMTSKARRIVTDLFQLFVEEPENLPEAWRQAATIDAPHHRKRIVGDYIAGMTDRYAMLEHQRLFDIYSRTI
jgi:dGTPase